MCQILIKVKICYIREECQFFMLKGPVIFLLLFKLVFIFLAVTFAIGSVEGSGWNWTVYLALAVAAYEIVDFLKTLNVLRQFNSKS